MSDLIVEITGGDSVYKKGDQINIDTNIELGAYESIVAFYNSSATLSVSKILLFILIASCFARYLQS